MMKNKDKDYISVVINNEGFDYAFEHYTDFEEIEDEKFHELRKNYLEAKKELAEYINKK